MLFDENRMIVISGAMRTWETGGGRSEASNRAAFVRIVLLRVLHEDWSIVIYDTYLVEAGFGTYFHYEDKWWIYGVPTLCTFHGTEGMQALLDNRFG
jgi:hypothetical protein